MAGGVCEVLDYEMDMMAEYVSEQSSYLISGNVPVIASLQKYVRNILASTRLPHTTILLALRYMAQRVTSLDSASLETFKDGNAWKLLTVGLVLASKYLDDNTFQNRSWADVSGIPVAELNKMEFEWLEADKWDLYLNLDTCPAYKQWLESWDSWSKNKKCQTNHRQRLQALAPLNTDVRTPPSTTWPSEASLTSRATSPEYWPSFYASQPQQNSWHPLTPPDSAFGTPIYSSSAASQSPVRVNKWGKTSPTYRNVNSERESRQLPHSPPDYSEYNAQLDSNKFNGYERAARDCNCISCLFAGHQSCFMPMANNSYRLQAAC